MCEEIPILHHSLSSEKLSCAKSAGWEFLPMQHMDSLVYLCTVSSSGQVPDVLLLGKKSLKA
jgi:hypothetical protein